MKATGRRCSVTVVSAAVSQVSVHATGDDEGDWEEVQRQLLALRKEKGTMRVVTVSVAGASVRGRKRDSSYRGVILWSLFVGGGQCV
jgi:hypothetical protein